MNAHDLASRPIPGDNPSGSDAKYEPAYAAVTAEIGKLGSATQGGAVDWSIVASEGEHILAEQSKDLQIAAYVAIAWQKRDGAEGLCAAVTLWLGLITSFWDTCYPPVAKLRRRTNAFDWWHENSLAEIARDAGKHLLAPDRAETLIQELTALDERAGECMPDATPLRDLLEAARQIPLAKPAPEPDKKETGTKEAGTDEAGKADAPTKEAPAVPKEENAPKEPKGNDTTGQGKQEGVGAEPSQAPKGHNERKEQSVDGGKSDAQDLKSAHTAFTNAASRYAQLAHREDPANPLPWQVLRIALWSKIQKLPPATDGQTSLHSPDQDRLAGIERMLESGKYLEAALACEDLFPSALFCLDIQYAADRALDALGAPFAEARARVCEETARFVARLPGVDGLAFDDGRSFANELTASWLASLANSSSPSVRSDQAVPTTAQSLGSAGATLFSDICQAARDRASGGDLRGALELLEGAHNDSPAATMRLRIAELELICAAQEKTVALALASDLLHDAEQWNLAQWDRALALDTFLAARKAFALAGQKDKALAAEEAIARIRPSAALGWKQ
ncbi:MAG: type VI secretion system protein TssA [Desulfovibrionaceae bacterium]|nr:type VI secretion system protein TssA [Desulfovibrionaceae bacterium]